MKRTLIVGMVVLVGAAACGKSEEQKAAEQTAAAAQQIADGAKKMAEGAEGTAKSAEQGMAQMMQGLQQMGQARNGGEPVQVVDYERLKELMPEVAGWERGKIKGSQTSMGGFSVSKAEADYKKGESRVDLEITDSSFNPILTTMFSMFGINYSERSDEGYKKGVKVGGFPGYEEWRVDSKHTDLNVLVGGRFIVHANGSHMDNADAARAFVEAVNLQKLSGLK